MRVGPMMESATMESLIAGTLAGTGSFRCEQCGFVLTLDTRGHAAAVPELRRRALRPRLAVHRGRRDRPAPGARRRPTRTTCAACSRPPRTSSSEPGQYLVYRDERPRRWSSPLAREWTRIGRSLAADVRFDDPTVSRRHALIVRQADGVRVLDDRSLNGVFVNGERVEWRALQRRRRDRRRALPPALRRGRLRAPHSAAARALDPASAPLEAEA